MAAWIGLVPRQHSTGGRDRLLGIGKRGDVYLRNLLILGARAVLRTLEHKEDRTSRWGFTKMGRFAVEYKRLFGSSPSETLARKVSKPSPRLADVLDRASNH